MEICQYLSQEEMKERCEECRTRTKKNMPARLSTVTLKDGKTYYVDRRLRQLRNILKPYEHIDFEDSGGDIDEVIAPR